MVWVINAATGVWFGFDLVQAFSLALIPTLGGLSADLIAYRLTGVFDCVGFIGASVGSTPAVPWSFWSLEVGPIERRVFWVCVATVTAIGVGYSSRAEVRKESVRNARDAEGL